MFRFAWVAATSVLLACSKPEMPKITPHSTTVSGVDATGLTLSSDLSVENPNSFAITVREVRGKFTVGSGVEVGQATTTSGASVGAKATSIVPSTMKVPWTNLAALSSMAGAPKVPFVFDGHANLGTDTWNVDVPFQLKGELDRNQVIAAGLRGLQLPGLPPLPQ